MMIFGLISAVLGLVLAATYSSMLGAILFLMGAGILARGYLAKPPEAKQTRSYESSSAVTYNIRTDRKS